MLAFRLKIASFFAPILVLATSFCFSGTVQTAIPPDHYSLSVAKTYESTSSEPEWVFILGGTGAVRGGETVCKSVTSLKKLLKGLPQGSTLDWYPSCILPEFEVLKDDLEDLKAICQKAGVTFTIHPSG